MEELLNVLDGYFGTLVKTGYIPIETAVGIVLMDFINELNEDQELPLIATCEQLDKICELKECLKQNCYNMGLLLDMCCLKKPKKSLDYIIKLVEDTDKTVKELEVWKNTIDSNISELVTEAIEKYPWDTLPDEALSHKADKVENAIEGHFASLDSNGNLQDSNYNYNSFAPSTHSHSEIKAPGAFANYAFARIESGTSVPAFKLKVGGMNDMSAQVEVNVDNIGNLQRALANPSTTVPEDDDTKLITSKAVYNAVTAPREDIRNGGSRVRCKYNEDEGKSSIKFYVQDDDSLEEFEAEINTENIGNLNRALETPDNVVTEDSDNLITSGAVYNALSNISPMGIYTVNYSNVSSGNTYISIANNTTVGTYNSFVDFISDNSSRIISIFLTKAGPNPLSCLATLIIGEEETDEITGNSYWTCSIIIGNMTYSCNVSDDSSETSEFTLQS